MKNYKESTLLQTCKHYISKQSIRDRLTTLFRKHFELQETSVLRKHQITQFNLLIKFLLEEKRVTKEEVQRFITSKKEAKQELNIEDITLEQWEAAKAKIKGVIDTEENEKQLINDKIKNIKNDNC